MSFKCECCGNPLDLRRVIHYDGHMICPICNEAFGYCQTCKEQINCNFITSSSSTPQQIQQQIRQGPMIITQTIKNPKRIEECCKECKCVMPEDEMSCIRTTLGFCGNWELYTNS